MTVSDKPNVKNIWANDLAPSTQRADSVQSNPRSGGFKRLSDWRRLLTPDDRWQASSLFISSPPCRELLGPQFCKSGNQGSRSHSQSAASSRMPTVFPGSKLTICEACLTSALSYLLHSLPLSSSHSSPPPPMPFGCCPIYNEKWAGLQKPPLAPTQKACLR